tara:strand:+ start:1347 stop:1754 length:408 start_codon:yes stop_codon:yes gene_type:complete
MSIPKTGQIIKRFRHNLNSLFFPIFLILITSLAYGLGLLQNIKADNKDIHILEPAAVIGGSNNRGVSTVSSDIMPSDSKQENVGGTLVGSKKGSKYHFPWCSGAQRIKEENKIWFADRVDAESKGYTPAANCPGL